MKILGLFFIFISFPVSAYDSVDHTKMQIRRILEVSPYRASVTVTHVESGKTLSVRGKKWLPMASVYKFPIALATLKYIELGSLKAEQKIRVKAGDILPGYAGPLKKMYPNGGVSFKLIELVKYMVRDSDNSASDLVLKELGGPEVVNKQLRFWGYKEISVDSYERTLLQGERRKGVADSATTRDLVALMAQFHEGKVLNKKYTEILQSWMTNPGTPGHIANGLPQNTKSYHKSGWCSKNRCLNDLAIIELPEAKGHLAIGVLVNTPFRKSKEVSNLIAEVSRLSYEGFTR